MHPFSRNSSVGRTEFDQLEPGLGLWDCWVAVRRRLPLIIVIVVCCLAITMAALCVMTPKYTATSTILIQPDIPQVLDVVQLLSSTTGDQDHDYYKTQYAMLQSPTLAAEVIRNLNLEHSPLFAPRRGTPSVWARMQGLLARVVWEVKYPGVKPVADDSSELGVKPGVIAAYLSMLKVTPTIGTRLVQVSFSSPDPALASRIVNAHVDAYIQRGLELRHQAGQSARGFLAQQLDGIKQRVERSEAALNTYRHSKGIVSFAVDDQSKIAEDRLAGLTQALTEAETSRIRFEAEMKQVRSGDFGSLPEVISNQMITTLRPQLDTLQAQYAAMQAQYRAKWPPLIQLRSRIQETRNRLTAEMASVATSIEREYHEAAAREQTAQALVDAEKESDLTLNDQALQDAVLAREVEANRSLYENVLKRMQEMGVSEYAPVSNVTILDRAVSPRVPSSPQTLRALAISGLLALLVSAGLILVLDQFDTSFKSVEEVERSLHLPFLALIPDFSLMAGRRGVRGQSRNDRRTDAYASSREEAYRSIRSALLFSRAGGAPRSVLFTSAIPREGKTHTAINTAMAFSYTGKTLLLDADLRAASCIEMLSRHVTSEPADGVGLTEVLVGQCEPDEAAQLLDDRLFFIAPGSPAPNPPELLISARMRDLLAQLSDSYDHVFVDSAPVMAASDTIGIATMVDGVIMVIGPGTPKKAACQACDRLVQAGAKLLGFVYNRADLTDPGHREHYQYHQYFLSYEASKRLRAANVTEPQAE